MVKNSTQVNKMRSKTSLTVHNPQSQSSEITTVRFLCMLREVPYTHTHTQGLFFIQKRSYVNIYCFASCFLYPIIYLGDYFLQNTGVGCHALLQGILLTQEPNPDLPHCRQILYCLSHQGSQEFT